MASAGSAKGKAMDGRGASATRWPGPPPVTWSLRSNLSFRERCAAVAGFKFAQPKIPFRSLKSWHGISVDKSAAFMPDKLENNLLFFQVMSVNALYISQFDHEE
ncbi:hypothetical protein ABC766_14100 [Methylobacterium fujisawaense]|uniref:hypothetical protein n=1 Tax=Methylobacterium fujisawaense TaxID=107400 RepID=UPI0031F5D04A